MYILIYLLLFIKRGSRRSNMKEGEEHDIQSGDERNPMMRCVYQHFEYMLQQVICVF